MQKEKYPNKTRLPYVVTFVLESLYLEMVRN